MGRLGQVICLLNFKIKTVNRSLRQEDCFLPLSFLSLFINKDQFTVLILKFGTQNFTDPGLLNMTMKDPADPHLFVVVVLPSQVFLIYWLNNQLLCLCLQARKAQGSLFFFPLVYLIMMIIILIKLVVIAVIISLISWFVICCQDCFIVFLKFGKFQMDWNIYS